MMHYSILPMFTYNPIWNNPNGGLIMTTTALLIVLMLVSYWMIKLEMGIRQYFGIFLLTYGLIFLLIVSPIMLPTAPMRILADNSINFVPISVCIITMRSPLQALVTSGINKQIITPINLCMWKRHTLTTKYVNNIIHDYIGYSHGKFTSL